MLREKRYPLSLSNSGSSKYEALEDEEEGGSASRSLPVWRESAQRKFEDSLALLQESISRADTAANIVDIKLIPT